MQAISGAVLGVLASPVKLARWSIGRADTIGQKVADFLVPADENAPANANAPTAASTKAAVLKAAPLRGVSKPAARATQKRSQIKVKTEAMRDQPTRASRRGHKSGFYSESNLQSLAWAGSGSVKDPILLE